MGDYIDAGSDLKVVSLYGKKKKPQPEDLSGIDVMIFDMQDVGSTFLYLSVHVALRDGSLCGTRYSADRDGSS